MKFDVIISTSDGYWKTVEATSEVEARAIVEAEDGWGSPDHGWHRTDDCYSDIDSIMKAE